jgi:hypothetical protein
MSEKPLFATREELIGNTKMQRPHVVILGAGASVASCLNGDKNGRRLPTMENFVEIVGLGPLLKANGIKYEQENFETVYSLLYADLSKSNLIKEIELVVHDYFSNLELSSHPTLYDHLLLSLRRKDAIFTFNWDPFLYDAWVRNLHFGLPKIFFLHGNVRAAYCVSHPYRWAAKGNCPDCGKSFVSTKLLYPIKIKDYTSNDFIAAQWKNARQFLADAFTLTIFGYGAPNSDVEAINIMKTAWHQRGDRPVEHVEIIDVKPHSVLYETWEPFIPYSHYKCRTSFYESWIANYPRRSGEALWAPTVEGRAAQQFGIPKDLEFDDLYNWLDPIAQYEGQLAE